LERRTEDVEDIAGKPNYEKLKRQAIGRSSLEVFNYLGRENHNPAGN
jgi:hypothetical protein